MGSKKKKRPKTDYKAMVGIDLDALEEEWVVQADRSYDVNSLLAIAKKRLSEAKAAEDVAEADAATAIRKNPEKHIPGGKLTDAALKEQVPRTPSVRQAVADRIDAQYRVDMLYAAVNALETKKNALQDLVKLFGMSYFGQPRVDGDVAQSAKQRIQDREKKKVRSGR